MLKKFNTGLAVIVISQSVLAGTAKDLWNQGAFDYANTSAMAYSDVSTIGPDFADGGGYVIREADQWGVGTASVSSASATSSSESQFGLLKGFASTNAFGDYGEAHFENGFRDALTVTGGTGVGTLQISGHADGLLSGKQSYFAVSSLLQNSAGSTLLGMAFLNSDGAIVPSGTDCVGAGTCAITVNGEFARIDFTISLTFEYGVHNLLISQTNGFASTGSDNLPSEVNFLSTSTIDAVVVPDGAILTSAAGPMLFQDGAWHYVQPTVVPEPETYALMLFGLAGVVWIVRRRRANVAQAIASLSN